MTLHGHQNSTMLQVGERILLPANEQTERGPKIHFPPAFALGGQMARYPPTAARMYTKHTEQYSQNCEQNVKSK